METRDAIGIIELASIYKGYAVQDEVLKQAHVEKLIARSICSACRPTTWCSRRRTLY